MNLSARTGKLVCSYGVSPEDEIILISSRGRLIRLASDEIPMLGRTARGSILVRLDEGDSVADLSIVPAEVCEEE